jgi:hypothetical protein
MLGGEHLFQRNAQIVAGAHGVNAGRRSLYWVANIDQLAGAMADLGAASAELAQKISARLAQRSEADIEANLYPKLVRIFGEQKVSQKVEVTGASAHRWKLSALVHLEGQDMAFQAVTNHHNSVYSSGTMFHDLSLLDRKPIPVAVVRDKGEMGDYLRILAQTANVIQEDVAEAALLKLAA